MSKVNVNRGMAQYRKRTTPAPATPAPATPAPATPSPATPSPATPSPATPAPKQNVPGASGVRSGLPAPGGRRYSGISPTGPTKTTEKEDRDDRRALRNILLGYLKDREAQDRADARQQAGFEHAERLAAMRGPRVYKFSATMNGAGGVHYHVRYKDIGRPDGFSYAGGRGNDSLYPQSGNPAQSRFEQVMAKMLERLDDPRKGAPQSNGRGVRGTVTPAWDYSGWRPEDTEKGKRKAYVREDFLGAMDKDRTGRYQGGYLDPEYRDRWIDFHMGGVKPGDPRYDPMYRQTAAKWDLVRQQLDQRWSDYGNTVLRGVDAKAAASQGDAAAARAAEVSAQTGVPRAEAAAEAAVDAAKINGQDAAAAAMGAPVAKEPTDKKKPKATQGDLGGGVSSQPPEHLILESHVKKPPSRLITGESPALLDRAVRIFGQPDRGGAPVLSEGARLEGIFGARPRPPDAERQYTSEEMNRWEGVVGGDLRPGEHLTPNGGIVSDMLHRRDNSTFNERRNPVRWLEMTVPRREGTRRKGGTL